MPGKLVLIPDIIIFCPLRNAVGQLRQAERWDAGRRAWRKGKALNAKQAACRESAAGGAESAGNLAAEGGLLDLDQCLS